MPLEESSLIRKSDSWVPSRENFAFWWKGDVDIHIYQNERGLIQDFKFKVFTKTMHAAQ